MNEYFPHLKLSRKRVKFELHLSYYATKIDLKNPTGVGISKCAKNFDLASLKSNVKILINQKCTN